MIDKDAMLAEIIEYSSPPRLAEDEFTLDEYRNRCPEPRPSRPTVRGRLESLVESGLLEARKVLHETKWVIAYRRVEEKWDAQTTA